MMYKIVLSLCLCLVTCTSPAGGVMPEGRARDEILDEIKSEYFLNRPPEEQYQDYIVSTPIEQAERRLWVLRAGVWPRSVSDEDLHEVMKTAPEHKFRQEHKSSQPSWRECSRRAPTQPASVHKSSIKTTAYSLGGACRSTWANSSS